MPLTATLERQTGRLPAELTSPWTGRCGGSAGCRCGGGDHVRAARLLGAADRMRESTRTSWFGPYRARRGTARRSRRASGFR
ncbi:hypothetical protein [Actinomadura sp. NPDC049753]|uniref:hypothetical protein n=1 Tax=Actinomadura sp. NPDC049753 TaxID=3154739 RepID=UPI00342FE838